MTPELIALLAQIPIVAVFVWYSERMYQQQRAERLESNQQARDERLERDREWRVFLEEERVQRRAAMAEGLARTQRNTDTLEAVTTAVSDLADAMTRHDANADKRNGAVSKAIQKLTHTMEAHDKRLADAVERLSGLTQT